MKRNKLIDNDWSCPLAVDRIKQEILRYIKSGKAISGQRLLPERRLAKLFNTSQYTVHRAVGSLIEKGLLYSRVGSGVYIRDQLQLGMVEKSGFLTAMARGSNRTLESRTRPLIVQLAESLPDEQRGMWQKVFTAFHQEFPFLRIHARYEEENMKDDADILIFSLAGTHRLRHLLRPLQIKDQGPLADMLKSDDLSPGLLEMGQFSNNLYALPLLRTTSMIYIHRGVFQRCRIDVETIRKPVDLFRVGSEIEDCLEGSIVGVFYRGFIYYAMLAGIHFSRQGNRLDFDAQRVRAVLEELRPFIRPHHYNEFIPPSIHDLLSGRCAIMPDYTYSYPELVNESTEMTPIRIPLADGGCACESCFMGGISRHSSYPDDAMCLLHFMAGRRAQEIIYSQYPHWLSVRKDVLERQKAGSPFHKGVVQYDFNPCGCRHLKDPFLVKDAAGHMNVEIMKYFKGLQEIVETLEKMKNIPPVNIRRRTSIRIKGKE